MRHLYRNIVIEKPRFVLLILLITVGFFSVHLNNFKLDASSDSLLLEDDNDLRIFRETSERYAEQDFLFITFTPYGNDLFNDTSLQVIRDLKTELLQLPKTDSVFSLVDAPLLKLVDGSLSEVASHYKTLNDKTVDKNKAKLELTQSPIFKKLLINEKGNTTALQVILKNNEDYLYLQKEKNRLSIQKLKQGHSFQSEQELAQVSQKYEQVKTQNDQENHENIVAIRDIMDKYRQHGTLYLGGVSMIADDMITFIRNDLVVFGCGMLIFIILMLAIIFRRIRWILLPLLSCLFSSLIMMGLLGWIGWRVTVISSNFISLMLILTMSMNLHLIVRYRQLSQDMQGANQHELIFQTTQKMVWPCLYTALTTMIGFASLVFSDIKPVIDFGWMMTIGLGVTFLTNFLLFPSLLSLLAKASNRSTVKDEVPFTAVLARITERFGNSILVVSLLLAVMSAVGISQLKVENSFINYFRSSTEIYKGLKLIDEQLGGTTPVEILLRFKEYQLEQEPDNDSWLGDEFSENSQSEEDFTDFDDLYEAQETADPADTFFTSDKIDRIKEVHGYLEQNPAIGKVLSLASVLRLAEDLNKGQPFSAFELAVINKRMPVELKKAMITPYVSFEKNEARLSLRIVDSLPDLRRKELLDTIDRDLQEKFGMEQDEYQITGLLVLYNNMLQSLFQSQIQTLGAVMLGIALMLLILFRSIKLAIIGIVPNILAAAIILGLMGLLNIPLDLMTITIAAISIGIAVDNSIHYIYRFREELPNQAGDYLKTLYICHANIGRAVFYTATTIIIGFSILMFSNFIPSVYFGLLTALAMLIALLAALTLLPKLILWLKPF